MGRPSKFKPEFVAQATKLATLGATDREVAEFFEVSESTLNLWKHQHPEFSESLKVGKETADQRVEQSLYRRAVGYQHDDLHFSSYEGVVTATPYVKHYPPDTAAGIFWLKNRKPAEWRDRVTNEHTGEGGGPLVIVTGVPRAADPA
jgi:hypothetical protein